MFSVRTVRSRQVTDKAISGRQVSSFPGKIYLFSVIKFTFRQDDHVD
jgi:hypothetical protein